MEKNPPEKSNSFANANVNLNVNANPDDNTTTNNNNNNNPNPDLPSSPSSPSSDPLAGDSKSDSVDNSAKPPTDGDGDGDNNQDSTTPTTEEVAEKSEEEPTEEEEEAEAPAPDLSKLSEDIDRFLSLFESNQIPEEIPNFVDEFANLVEAQITKYSSDQNPIKWRQDSDEDSTMGVWREERESVTEHVGE